MAINRLETLKAMLEQDPANTFARYGLAMEYVNSGDLEQAVSEFQAVLNTDPGYSYAYFHGGQTLEKLGHLDQARTLYEQGVEASRAKGDLKGLSEIQGALDLLPL